MQSWKKCSLTAFHFRSEIKESRVCADKNILLNRGAISANVGVAYIFFFLGGGGGVVDGWGGDREEILSNSKCGLAA